MMRMFINSLSASAGGGLTYIRNVLPILSMRSDLQVIVAVSPELRQEFHHLRGLEFVELQMPVARRVWHEQVELSDILRNCRVDVLLSTGNFALRKSPVPQVLLSRNSLYLCRDYYRDLRKRHEYRLWLDTRLKAILAKKSTRWANATVAPSNAFAIELQRWTKNRVLAVPHGFDRESFTRDSRPLSSQIEAKLQAAEGFLKLLFVSHYNYYRNFETLIRALPLLRNGAGGRPVKLLLTCKLAEGANPGAYRPEVAADLIRSLGVADMVIELGSVPYRHLHQLYRRADVYVTPAYTETFAHPLVEAMASGIPIAASDLPVHREICGDAAEYFPTFSPAALAETVLRLAASPESMSRMGALGLKRSNQFSWDIHVKRIVEICQSLTHVSAAMATHAA